DSTVARRCRNRPADRRGAARSAVQVWGGPIVATYRRTGPFDEVVLPRQRDQARKMTLGGTISLRGAGRNLRRIFLLLLLALGLALDASPAGPQVARSAVVLNIDGAIGPASADYFKRGLAEARARDAAIAILRLDTPGGLDTSMRDMIRELIASPVPVVVF